MLAMNRQHLPLYWSIRQEAACTWLVNRCVLLLLLYAASVILFARSSLSIQRVVGSLTAKTTSYSGVGCAWYDSRFLYNAWICHFDGSCRRPVGMANPVDFSAIVCPIRSPPSLCVVWRRRNQTHQSYRIPGFSIFYGIIVTSRTTTSAAGTTVDLFSRSERNAGFGHFRA